VTSLLCALLLGSCERERRELRPLPARLSLSSETANHSELQPGDTPSAAPATARYSDTNPYDGSAYAIAEGQRLFDWYNCSGCHAHGAGGMGPPLIKDKWIYGVEPAKMLETIVKGRPNGMPAWGSKIPEYQIWQLVAFVRSMNGLQPRSATPIRGDTLQLNQQERVPR
jgi:cytochrome c oxidase cbb3-type subunit 3